MTEQDRIRRLQDIFASISTDSTFTEHQTAARGDVTDDREVDAALAALVGEMRDRYGFRTALDDDALVAVVRGFYARLSDDAIAEAVGTEPEQVARARANLHLFRPEDVAGPFDVRTLRELLEGGATVAEAAADLGASESTVGRYASVLRRQAEARRSGYRYPDEFESILGVADDATLAATFRTDRRTMEEVVD